MGNHHDNHHSEQKPVSFAVPFILATVTLIAMLLLLSLCDPRHGHHGACECKEGCSKECMEACEKGDHSKHDEHGNEIKSTTEHHEEHATAPAVPADTTKAEAHDHAADTTHKEHAH
jgi:hypothetical protein